MVFLSPGITIYIIIISFLFGAVFASFLSCMGWRLIRGESILKGRSHCDFCGHPLAWYELIPIVSFLRRKGHCTYCKKKISPVLLWGEVVLGILFVILTLKFDITWKLFLYLVFTCILFFISVTDIYGGIIPDVCLLVAIAFRGIVGIFFESMYFEIICTLLIDGLLVSVPLLLLVLLMEKIKGREMMGGGDIKLVFVMGLYLGWQRNLLALFFGCLLGIIYITGKLGKEGRKVTFSFGPFLSMGALLSLVIGEEMIQWYLSLFV